jgi:hypothetical protein
LFSISALSKIEREVVIRWLLSTLNQYKNFSPPPSNTTSLASHKVHLSNPHYACPQRKFFCLWLTAAAFLICWQILSACNLHIHLYCPLFFTYTCTAHCSSNTLVLPTVLQIHLYCPPFFKYTCTAHRSSNTLVLPTVLPIHLYCPSWDKKAKY